MADLEKLQKLVDDLYLAKNPNRDEWTDWIYPNHVLVVEKKAKELAERFGVSTELSQAAALLHDIADVKMARKTDGHEEESNKIARELLRKSDYSDEEIQIIIDDAMRFHSCHDNERPQTDVGQVLATADGLAHLTTNFYSHVTRVLMQGRDQDWIEAWIKEKLPRDFEIKIIFDEVREETRPRYNELVREFVK